MKKVSINKQKQILQSIPVFIHLTILFFVHRVLRNAHVIYHLTYLMLLFSLSINHFMPSIVSKHATTLNAIVYLRVVESLFVIKTPTSPTYVTHCLLLIALVAECIFIVNTCTDSLEKRDPQAEMLADSQFRRHFRHFYVAIFVWNSVIIHNLTLPPHGVLFFAWIGLAIVEQVKTDIMEKTMFLADPAVKCMSLLSMDGGSDVWAKKRMVRCIKTGMDCKICFCLFIETFFI